MAITNQEILDKLIENELWTQSDWKTMSGPYHTLFRKASTAWYLRNKWGSGPVFSFMVPVDTYTKYVARFPVQYKVGSMVRLCRWSKRTRARTSTNNNVGDTYDWGHLGFGSGKEYNSDKIIDILVRDYNYRDASQIGDWRLRSFRNKMDQRMLIGNSRFPLNLIASYNAVTALRNRGIKKNDWDSRDFMTEDFVETTKIKADGILGDKTLINGWINNVYIHFLFPKWERRREARYEIVFETGARGIFTSDYFDRVYDTDFDWQDAMTQCSYAEQCDIECWGAHDKLHVHRETCDLPCQYSRTKSACVPMYDYRNVFDLTYGKALDYVKTDV